ncbi:hypothetical protein GF407_11040 [candidate division KSB1 bacterium]|nr:hypothetical protein [candidate division KSB1 bacterium]
MRCSWFRDHYRQVHMDFHMPEFPTQAIRNFDVESFVSHLLRGRVNMVALFAKCHFGNSFYNTVIGHKHSGLEADFLMQTATEARKHGIKTLAYYSLCVDKHAYDHNPDWRYVDVSGQTYGGTFGSVCMNTPYKDELALPQMKEIAANYPVDGFFIDIPVPWGAPDFFCFCKFCRQRWKEEFNTDLSADIDPLQRQRLNMILVSSWLRQIRYIIKQHNPNLVLCVNLAGTPVMSKTVKELVEIGVWESQPSPGDYLGHSFACRLGRHDLPDVQVMTVRFYQGWGDMSLKPEAQLTTELSAIIGNGMVPNVGDQVNIDGTLQKPVYDLFRKSFGFVAEREQILKSATPFVHTAVLLPVPDAELPFSAGPCSRDDSLDWKESPPSWRGVHKCLIESHIQTDLFYSVLIDTVDFPVVILPEPGTYQSGMTERLRRYVAEGGTLIAVGNSILENGQCPLQDLFGIRYLEPLSFSIAHFKPRPEVQSPTDDIPLQIRGPVYKVIAEEAQVLADLYFPVGETQPPVKGFRHPCPPAQLKASGYPMATVHTCGKGRAVYIAASLFDIYWRTNHHWLRQFAESLIRHIDDKQPVNIDASGKVEANLLADGDDLLLALIHYSLGHQGGQSAIAAIEKIEPITAIHCQLRFQNIERVTLEPQGQDIPFHQKNDICSFTLPDLESLAIIRLRGALKNHQMRSKR